MEPTVLPAVSATIADSGSLLSTSSVDVSPRQEFPVHRLFLMHVERALILQPHRQNSCDELALILFRRRYTFVVVSHRLRTTCPKVCGPSTCRPVHHVHITRTVDVYRNGVPVMFR